MRFLLISALLALALFAATASAAKAKVLVVFAHQEPQSFCFAMRDRILRTLMMKGHEVRLSNLVQLKMIQSLDRGDFTKAYDPTYFHPQLEQLQANLNNRTTFSKELRLEHDKVQWADIMLFVFPYYVMHMPSIMKSWMERVFSYGFAYGEGKSLKGRKAMMIYATGATKAGLKELEPHFWELMHGVFAFGGLTSLQPYTAYAAPSVSVNDRKAYLIEIEKIVDDIEHRAPYKFLSSA